MKPAEGWLAAANGRLQNACHGPMVPRFNLNRVGREKPQESVSSAGSLWSLQRQTWVPEHVGIKEKSASLVLRVCTLNKISGQTKM